MAHTLPPLPYAYDALEPHIDAKTMEIHHVKHHQAYIDKLNAALDKYPDLQKKSLHELLSDLNSVPEDIRTAVRNNGGGHYNHSLFWNLMHPQGGGLPIGEMGEAIDKTFGSFETFKKSFEEAGMSRFGSGWAWLIVGNEGLKITSTANQDSPIMEGQKIILGVDVWEHAYYLKYQNRRAEYLQNWWNVVSWQHALENFQR